MEGFTETVTAVHVHSYCIYVATYVYCSFDVTCNYHYSECFNKNATFNILSPTHKKVLNTKYQKYLTDGQMLMYPATGLLLSLSSNIQAEA